MTLTVFLMVLLAAAIHASWNALVKSTGDKVVSMTAVTVGHAPLALLAMPFVPMPKIEALPYLIGSVFIHTGYQLALMLAYRLGDFTQVYPIARGSGPALVMLFSVFVLGIAFSAPQLAAVALVVAGIFCLALLRQTDGLRNPQAVGAALMTGCFIASYSVVDGLGARAAGSAVGYIAWMTTINALVFAIIIGIVNRPALKAVFTQPQAQRTFVFGGAGSVLAYVMVVWAMTQAPIALVTALRETSTVFALFLGVVFLKERLTIGKVVATVLVLSGVLLLRMNG
ncbi:EamA family transporter [Pseudahrensia aquimaris]|uniref:EamA family transporter n=1 Tax=Pseudahrensia aquimaris TaxID=744461 RepID=A0ABW3FEL6_9HYPH